MFSDNLSHSYEEVESISKFLLDRSRCRPKVGIICGADLSGLADVVQDKEIFPYGDIPKFPVATIGEHPGRLIFGTIEGKDVVCMQGRFHIYEGYSMEKVILPVRVMHLLGVEVLIITNAAGGVNQDYNVGDIMVIKDHVNFPGLCGFNPLYGPNNEKFGPRFPTMVDAYHSKLRNSMRQASEMCGLSSYMREGVYGFFGGPSFETVMELRFLKTIGVDAVGGSTVPEVITARHCGIKVCGMSLIANKFDINYNPVKDKNYKIAQVRAIEMQSLISNFVKVIDV